MLASVLQAASPKRFAGALLWPRSTREARRHLQRDWNAPTHKQGADSRDAAACQRHKSPIIGIPDATLYFVFACTNRESDLGILDLIQVFVEALDRSFENVCELDLIFHSDKCHYVLDCVEIKILRRVRAESSRRPPRHRRDACSMAW